MAIKLLVNVVCV